MHPQSSAGNRTARPAKHTSRRYATVRYTRHPDRFFVSSTICITAALVSAGIREKSSNLKSFFQLQVLRRDLRDHRPHPLDLGLVPCLRIVLARRPVCIPLQRHCRTTLGYRPPAVEHRGGQAVTPTDLADRDPRLIRLTQNLQFLLSRKSPMLAFAHKPRYSCRPTAADRSLSFPR